MEKKGIKPRKRWICTGTTNQEDFDWKPRRSGRIKRCYLCKREKNEWSRCITGKGANHFDGLPITLHLLEVDLDNGKTYGFYLCEECRLLLKLPKSIVRYEINFDSPPY